MKTEKPRAEGALFVSDVVEGGAAIACERIIKGVNDLDDGLCRWVTASAGRETLAINAEMWPSSPALMKYEIRRRLTAAEKARTLAMHRFHETNVGRIIRRSEVGVVCLHNIHQKMSFDLLEGIPARTPLLIDLHDMWYLTGYCCHCLDCDKYVTGCKGGCPQMGKWEVPLADADIEWRRRERFYRRNAGRITFIAPSRWMARCAGKRFQGKIEVHLIPNPVDTALYKPVGERPVLRELLGLDRDKPLILCGAVTLRDEHKGARYLKEALRQLQGHSRIPFTVAFFGEAVDSLGIPGAVNLGPIKDERLLNLYYNAATVFVLPSVAESFGLVFAEALAAGTPCVAFDTTACSEIVREGETGYLATPCCDVSSLAAAMERAVSAGDANPLSLNCRKEAVANYDTRIVARQYRDVIRKTVDRARSAWRARLAEPGSKE